MRGGGQFSVSSLNSVSFAGGILRAPDSHDSHADNDAPIRLAACNWVNLAFPRAFLMSSRVGAGVTCVRARGRARVGAAGLGGWAGGLGWGAAINGIVPLGLLVLTISPCSHLRTFLGLI